MEDKKPESVEEIAARNAMFEMTLAGALIEGMAVRFNELECPWGEWGPIGIGKPTPDGKGFILVPFRIGYKQDIYDLCKCHIEGIFKIPVDDLFNKDPDGEKPSEIILGLARSGVDGALKYYRQHSVASINSAEHDLKSHMDMHENQTDIPCERCTKLMKDLETARENADTKQGMH